MPRVNGTWPTGTLPQTQWTNLQRVQVSKQCYLESLQNHQAGPSFSVYDVVPHLIAGSQESASAYILASSIRKSLGMSQS